MTLQQSPDFPRHVFHHLPKCGGNSLRIALAFWFRQVADYRQRGGPGVGQSCETFAASPLDLSILTPIDYLSGHFDTPGAFLWQRYPQVHAPPYRLITFLRDPLARAVSHFRYGRATGLLELHGETLETHLEATTNPLARLIAPEPEAAPDWLRRYWFVGRLETAETDLERLRAKLGRAERPSLPHVNATPRLEGCELPQDLVLRFRERNAIDYRLWEMADDSLAVGQAC